MPDHPQLTSENKRVKKDEIKSRINNYVYALEDYDRSFGKGKFLKKFPYVKEIIDSLQAEYLKELNKEIMEIVSKESD